jgi:hypothetical protein
MSDARAAWGEYKQQPFKKDREGNWYLDSTPPFFIGTQDDDNGENFYQHLLNDNTMTTRDVIDDVMDKVNLALIDNAEKEYHKDDS